MAGPQAIRLLVLGLLMPSANGLILFAYTLTPVAYVVAGRKIRLAFGTMVGVFVLKEGYALSRISGAALIGFGVVLLQSEGRNEKAMDDVLRLETIVQTRVHELPAELLRIHPDPCPRAGRSSA